MHLGHGDPIVLEKGVLSHLTGEWEMWQKSSFDALVCRSYLKIKTYKLNTQLSRTEKIT